MSHMDQDQVEHPELEDILDYVGDRMSEEDLFLFESHLADCDQCIERVRAHTYLSTHLEELFETPRAMEVTVPVPGREPLLVRISGRLGELADRVYDLLTALPGRIEVAFKVAVDSAQKQVGIVAENFEGLSREGSPLHFAPGSALVPLPAVRGDAEAQKPEREFSRLLQSQAYPETEIHADAMERSVTVSVRVREREVLKGRWTLALLIPEAGGEVRVAELRAAEDTRSGDFIQLIARFDNVEGPHVLLVETGPPFIARTPS
jgi:hypothetical protein